MLPRHSEPPAACGPLEECGEPVRRPRALRGCTSSTERVVPVPTRTVCPLRCFERPWMRRCALDTRSARSTKCADGQTVLPGPFTRGHPLLNAAIPNLRKGSRHLRPERPSVSARPAFLRDSDVSASGIPRAAHFSALAACSWYRVRSPVFARSCFPCLLRFRRRSRVRNWCW